MASLGKKDVLLDNYEDGRPTISIWLTRTVYKRKDGTYFIKEPRGRTDVQAQKDGTFYLRHDKKKIGMMSIADIIRS